MKIVAIKNCKNPHFIVDNLRRGEDKNHPFREFPNERIICTNFNRSAHLKEWLPRIEWEKVDKFKCGYFKDEKQ